MSKGRPTAVGYGTYMVQPPAGHAPAPADLDSVGVTFWDTVFASATWLDPKIDGYVVRQAAFLAQDIEDARAEFRRTGRYQEIPNGSIIRSAGVTDLERLQIQQNSYLAALGLTPTDRARLGVETYREDSPLVELQRRREARMIEHEKRLASPD